ncbi:unnamed protein product [Rotaria sp. Silwood1]|nr:unnamed protein product [Rotaria sp. Silwood1]CAF1181817.1 unnamed protein product [Rotaria sp. Silwood1]CAF3436079.1 unnamed protein product [Rotaria sp. Silwood1]CAF4811697.1 unnamed protein product [Rotaria sp. Silwood1]
MSSGQGSSSASAPESAIKGETSGTGLGPGGQYHRRSSGHSFRVDNAPGSETKGGSGAGESGSSGCNQQKH